MEAEQLKRKPHDEPSLGSALRDVSSSAADLIKSEVELLKAEIQESSRYLGRHAAQGAVFGALLALSVLPFLAFLVIGLGRILNNNYWLSSLIVALVCAVVGGAMAFRAYKKIKREDLTLPRTRESLQSTKAVVTDKIDELKHNTSENVENINKRRTA